MDRTVTAKFYRVVAEGHGQQTFEQLLEPISNIQPVSDRERDTGADVVVRLERFQRDRQFIKGDFCRIQNTNIPPEVENNGLAPLVLAGGRGLGHLSAFVYHPPTQVLLWQENRNGTSKDRLVAYLSNGDAQRLFGLNPLISADALQRLMNSEPKKFIFKFAEMENLEVAENPHRSPMENAAAIAQAFRGPQVEITVGVGHANTQLDKRSIFRFLQQMLTRRELKKAQVIENSETPPIDFLTEHMQNKTILDLPTDDVERNYLTRQSFLTSTFEAKLDEIIAAYGP